MTKIHKANLNRSKKKGITCILLDHHGLIKNSTTQTAEILKIT